MKNTIVRQTPSSTKNIIWKNEIVNLPGGAQMQMEVHKVQENTKWELPEDAHLVGCVLAKDHQGKLYWMHVYYSESWREWYKLEKKPLAKPLPSLNNNQSFTMVNGVPMR